MARAKRIALGLIVLFVLAQVFQPKRTNPPVIESRSIQAHVQVPEPVQPILKRACGDCHSNSTVWPWYSHVAPVSWLITDDVNQGRRHINFDDWDAQRSPSAGNQHLALICKEVREGGMPPFTYRMMHQESRLSPDETNALCSWSQTFGSPSGSPEKNPD